MNIFARMALFFLRVFVQTFNNLRYIHKCIYYLAVWPKYSVRVLFTAAGIGSEVTCMAFDV